MEECPKWQYLIKHAASKLAKTTFNKFTPPPKKMALLGGVSFLEYFHEFLGLGHKKIFGKTLGQSQCFGIIIGQFRPFYEFGKFKTSGIFSIFGQIWQLLFSKYDFGPNLVLKSLKMVFLTFFRSWRWFISILIHFWAFKILSFHAFFMLKSVVFASFEATCYGENAYILSKI